jgi:muramoyltetrapeptide carboxypeptidase
MPATGEYQGTIWGGNLALVAHLVGTPYLPPIRGGILFLEDVNEHPYRIERMLLQLHHAGVLDAQRLLLLGQFTGFAPVASDNGYGLDDAFAALAARTRTPILRGMPFGHVRSKITIPVGATATVRVERDRYRIRFSRYPMPGRGPSGAVATP